MYGRMKKSGGNPALGKLTVVIEKCSDISYKRKESADNADECQGSSCTSHGDTSDVELPERCDECRQTLNNPEVRIFSGDSEDAVEECVALSDPKLSLFTGHEKQFESFDMQPQHKLTNFRMKKSGGNPALGKLTVVIEKCSNISYKRKESADKADEGQGSSCTSHGDTSEIQLPERCDECRQTLNNPEVRIFSGDSEDAVEEFVALSDPKLSLFTGHEKQFESFDMQPQHKLTNFSVYDKNTHLCAFDTGLIEEDVELYFSGYLKPIYHDNPEQEDGVPAKKLGPIAEWWIAGYDGGENVIIGFTTACADYFLMKPSEEYAPFIHKMTEKAKLSKIVIEFLLVNPDSSFVDLLNKVQTSIPPENCSSTSFTEESLLCHSQFIIQQVESFDNARDSDELTLLDSPCIRDFIKLSGVTLGKSKRAKRQKNAFKCDNQRNIKATTTPLVRHVFHNFLDDKKDSKSTASGQTCCGICRKCQQPDCGKCNSCIDMVKFGGSGQMKRCCVERRCPYIDNKEADDNENLEEYDTDEMEKENQDEVSNKVQHTIAKGQKIIKTKVKWVGKPSRVEKNKQYYSTVLINKQEVNVGDFVKVCPDDPYSTFYIACVTYMWENLEGEKMFHSRWMYRASETVLGETADPSEVFLADCCDDNPLGCILEKCTVVHKDPLQDWHKDFGVGGVDMFTPGEEDGGNKFFYQKWYDSEMGRFTDPPTEYSVNVDRTNRTYCESCERISANELFDTAVPTRQGSYYNSFSLRGINYNIGDHVYLEDGSFSFNMILKDFKKSVKKEGPVDEDIFTEYYRKNNFIKGGNQEVPWPFPIGRILKIYTECSSGKLTGDQEQELNKDQEQELDKDQEQELDKDQEQELDKDQEQELDKDQEQELDKDQEQELDKDQEQELDKDQEQELDKDQEVFLEVAKFYRPEDTHKGPSAAHQADNNLLYWTNEACSVSVSNVRGKCSVVYGDDINEPIHQYTAKGPDRFYFFKAYDSKKKMFEELTLEEREQAMPKRGRGKGKGKAVMESTSDTVNTNEEETKSFQKLKSLDVFAGCGGLSAGLHQAGIAESCWAIEKEITAAKSFQLNNQGCTVFIDDCNELLQLAIDGQTTNSVGQKLPQKGEVELLCGGPPCQGFSRMNRFTTREHSTFKNSLVLSFLSYCDFYRPRFFILENVQNFVYFKRSIVLKLTLRCLLRMGYQCTFGVLQAGSYGVPQTRRRAIIIAAAPGEVLPQYPEPTHCFSPRACKSTVKVDGKSFRSNITRSYSAPYRTVTVRDAISDLPDIVNGVSAVELSYKGEAMSHFQRKMRGDQNQLLLRDHICKGMSALAAARIEHIPLAPGSDWRDLPNTVVRLADGTSTKKLEYLYHDKKDGGRSKGKLRGVCSCATGRACDPVDRQSNTLIPWWLPHTGNRHNNWAGLYGRLDWDGHFGTTTTTPEPLGMQGRVLHPEQHRVVSLRECARSQGLPDTYRLYGTVLEKHRQVGNAVPPPLAAAIGRELKKSLEQKSRQAVNQTPMDTTE